ncbi:ABC transporter substrate-binding protein [Streptomyces bambusae]|uniref:ABC transporter substrate-binding protein n=1 Tax=Streptomyces bambusae TaxID=1550616 RepID=UPI001CFD3949|nr:ABC transporter substrate-binding protein [Streptomyces bambusae]MCB5163782.1 ABC transporter substrate-binding protein [Streptomyces bambusae]
MARLTAAATAAAALLATTGCGGSPAEESRAETGPAPAGYPLTVSNCGVQTTYQRPPQRTVALNQHATEVLLALGLEKSVTATGYLDDKVLPEYQAAYDRIKVVAKEYPSTEALLATEPDLVYGGYSSAFDEKEGRGRAALAKSGIHTHLNIESCTSGPVTTATVDEEVRTVAKIFGVPGRAEQLVKKMHATLDTVAGRLNGVRPAKVFVYDSGDKTAFTAGGRGIGNELIRLAGGANVFADVPKAFGDVSFEQVAERAPEVIAIYDYGDRPVAEKKKFLLAHPALKDVPAIKNKRFAVLPLSSAVLGVRVPAAVDSLAHQIHPDRFK